MVSSWLWRGAWLLLPLAWLSHRLHWADALTFALAALSLVPLARSMGEATEALAERMGPAAGSLLNASFGNAAELILAISALRHGHVALVKGSLTGSILANLLLVGGGAILVGGLRFDRLRFSRLAATSSVSTLFLALIALVVPTLLVSGGTPRARAALLSEEIAVVLLVMYGLTLLFQLRTHAGQFAGEDREPLAATPGDAAALQARAAAVQHGPLWKDMILLVVAAIGTALASELLVGALEGAVRAVHLPEAFVGVIVVAIVGNAAEHSTALLFGRRGDMDVALGIAWESSKQIALFVAPALVFVSLLLGAPMDLAFTRFEVISVGIAVIAMALIALDGETNWLEGAFLLAVYAVLGMGFYFVGQAE